MNGFTHTYNGTPLAPRAPYVASETPTQVRRYGRGTAIAARKYNDAIAPAKLQMAPPYPKADADKRSRASKARI